MAETPAISEQLKNLKPVSRDFEKSLKLIEMHYLLVNSGTVPVVLVHKMGPVFTECNEISYEYMTSISHVINMILWCVITDWFW